MNTINAKTFTCCGIKFRYLPEVDKLEALPKTNASRSSMPVTDCLLQGLKESPVMKFSDTLELIATLDCIREKANIRYSSDLSSDDLF